MSLLARFAPLALAIAMAPLGLFGQATEGVIFGTVTDSSGAVVPNAKITIASVERGIVRTAATNREGAYSMPDLDLGAYVVTVEAPGFKRVVNPPATITVKAQIRIDAVLEVGDVGQTVEVKATAAIIKTATAEVNNIITREQLQNLPTLGRNVLSIATLTPGVNGGTSGGRQAGISGAALVVGGAAAESNNFIIDGVANNMEFSGTLSVTPAIDAIQEFAVQTSQYSAEFGRSAGGVINMALKSGTNQLHGFAYDYLQNDALNARNYDFTGANIPKQPLRRNQFGAGAGGRVIKDRLFWFGNYEGMRLPSHSISQFIVPTAAEKTGDFSRSGYNIYDPFNTRPDPANPSVLVRQQFPNNVIPANRIAAFGAGLLKYFPDPNFVSPNPSIRNNLLQTQVAKDVYNQYNIKSDAVLNSANSLSGHYSFQERESFNHGWVPENRIGSTWAVNGINAGVNYTRVIRPTLFNDVRTSYNRTDLPALLENRENVMDPYRIPGWNTNPFGPGFPTVSVANVTGIAPIRIGPFGPPFRLTENTYQLLDTASWQKGSHSIKFGAGIDNQRLARYQARSGGGNIVANGSYTTERAGQAVAVPRSGTADFLLGLISSATTQYGFDAIRIYTYRFNAFIQDDWRITRKLTFNLGLRYDFVRPYHEEQDRISNFDLATGIRLVPDSARRVVQDTLKLPNGDLPGGWRYVPLDQVLNKPNWKDFSPRFGFAYAVSNRFVVRGGYGIYYAVQTSNTFNNAGTEGNPFFFDFSLTGDAANPVVLNQGFPSGGIVNVLASPNFSAYYGPLNRPTPYAQKYSGTIEWNPLKDTAVSAGYVGQRTLAIGTLAAGNMAQVPAATPILSRQPYPNVGFFWMYVPQANSNYNALIATVSRRYLHGLTFQSNFTWSKALGYNTGVDATLTNRWDYRYDYGPLDYNIPRIWMTSFTWQEPKLQGLPAIPRAILGGWSFSGILLLQSGRPFTVTAGGTVLNVGTTGGTGNRPNAIGNPVLPGDERSLNRWFDKNAFALPAPYTWGNAGKNILYGPGLANLDAALQKSFPVFRESHRLTFRMEAYNLTNRVNPGNPGSNFTGANFGVIAGLQSGARRMQAALRYDF